MDHKQSRGRSVDAIEKYQKQLLEQARHIYRDTPISEATERAYLATPRHRFVQRYREWGTKEWHIVTANNLSEYVATIYMDRPLILFGDDDENVPATISQPSFVLRMLDILQLEAGHRVFELGTGSGWNAALMSHLVGAEGYVESVEIIPELAQTAAQNVESLGIANVHIVAGDGADGYAGETSFDRAIFTAGTFDLPRQFYDQVREQGLLLVVIKTGGGGDNLFLLRKTNDHFESLKSMPCGFVQLRGRYEFKDLEPAVLEESVPKGSELQQKEVCRRRFWWGGKGKEMFVWTTAGIRSFLGIVEPTFRAFKTAKADGRAREYHYFGLWDQENHSLVVAKHDWLIGYGNAQAEQRLLSRVREWMELGMPTAACMDLKVGVPLQARDRQWIVQRKDSQFLWSLQP
jgi:protein-L-isoaspartate(D-aspartate) O-methyltransferase